MDDGNGAQGADRRATVGALALATGPVTWGVDFADAPGNPPWEQVLDEIAASGVGALELGPVGYLPEDPQLLRAALETRGLTAVGSFVFEDLHDPAAAEHVLSVAERACRAIAAAGGTVLVIIDRPGDERAATAGRSDAARRLDAGEWAAMLDTTRRVAALAGEHGLRPAFHPHAGGYVEFRDEIERLLDDSELDLCIDTGHAAYAGIEADEAIAAYASRLAHVHLKDVDRYVLAHVHQRRLGFWEAIEQRIFCPLGDGVVDVPAVLDALERAGYHGFATIEQDRVPGAGTPLEDLHACVRALGR
jgi:inosose dehydratase